MSRSIHKTLNHYWNKKYHDYADKHLQQEELEEIREAIWRKKALKKQVKKERKIKKNGFPFPIEQLPTIENIPIITKDQAEHLYYPLTEADIREVLGILPKDVSEGLSSITFCLGKEYMQQECDYIEKVDPYFQRVSSEDIKGIFLPPVLGTYHYGTNKIRLFGYITKDPIKNPSLAFLLKLRMLNTFLHELAHHYDNWNRVAKGRWLGHLENNVENYAIAQQNKWITPELIDYLNTTYSKEVTALYQWLEKISGCRIQIADLLKGGYMFTAYEAVIDLFAGVLNRERPEKVLYHFVNDLHHGAYYEEALSVLNQLLEKKPRNLAANILIPDIYVHQEQYEEARQLAEPLLLKHPKNEHLHKILIEAYFATEEWAKTIELVEKAKQFNLSKTYRCIHTECQFISHLYLKNTEQAALVWAQYPNRNSDQSKLRKEVYTSLLLVMKKDFLQARERAEAIYSQIPKSYIREKGLVKLILNYTNPVLNLNKKEISLTTKEIKLLVKRNLLNLLT